MQNTVNILTKKRLLFLLSFSLCLLCGCEKKTGIVPQEAPLTADAAGSFASGASAYASDASDTGNTAEEAQGTLFVHVCGAVRSEGVYELPEGSRVIDAVLAAGGFSQDADGSALNQAALLSDGLRLRVPFAGEETQEDTEGAAPFFSGTGGDARVNINTATVSELCTLSGIGEKKAADIVRYREAHGLFGSVDELTRVSGIGTKLLEKIRDLITV